METQQHIEPSGIALLGLEQGRSRALIVGMGVTGLSMLRFLVRQGIEVAMIDSRQEAPSLSTIEEEFENVAVFTGGFKSVVFEAATHLFVSPGVSLDEVEIQKAASRGVPVFGDIDLFAVSASAPIACITGSNGKSTVTTLLGEMAQQAGIKTHVGGNLGVPALDLLDDNVELYVLELSSFQLERTSQLKAEVATVLNVSADHMDRYDSFVSYAEAKERIFFGPGIAVVNRADDVVSNMKMPALRRMVSFGLDAPSANDYGVVKVSNVPYLAKGDQAIMSCEDVRIQGTHNHENALAAMAMADALSISRDAQIKALTTYKGLAHRTEWVAEHNGITWINDSKATNPGATLAALEGLSGPIVLIAGGDGKGANFKPLAQAIHRVVRLVIVMGQDAQRFVEEAVGAVDVLSAESIEQAVEMANENAKVGDTVLLSPACASLDQFKNYQERGERFATAVKALAI